MSLPAHPYDLQVYCNFLDCAVHNCCTCKRNQCTLEFQCLLVAAEELPSEADAVDALLGLEIRRGREQPMGLAFEQRHAQRCALRGPAGVRDNLSLRLVPDKPPLGLVLGWSTPCRHAVFCLMELQTSADYLKRGRRRTEEKMQYKKGAEWVRCTQPAVLKVKEASSRVERHS